MTTFNSFLTAIFGKFEDALFEHLNLQKVVIEHFLIKADFKEVIPLIVGLDKNGIPSHKEERICIGSAIPGLKVSSFQLEEGFRPSSSEIYTFMCKQGMGYEVFGGTGLNKGQFYAMQGLPFKFGKAGEAISYLSLLVTPMAEFNKKPYLFNLNVLVLKDAEMRSLGLVPGNTGIIMNRNIKIQGQFRAFDNDSALGKGAAFYWKELAGIGIKIDPEFHQYDLILSEDHFKTGRIVGGEAYQMVVGFTYDNTWTAQGPMGHSFEFYQFLRFDKAVRNYLLGHFPRIDYGNILIGKERSAALAAAKLGNQYSPLAIDTAVHAGYMAFGPDYPAVNDELQKRMLPALIKSRMAESHMKLVVLVTDEIPAIRIAGKGEKPTALLYKYPITAGIGKVVDSDVTMPFAAIQESTALKLNIDGDGDIVGINQGKVTDYIIRKGIVKPLRDIGVATRAKNADAFTLQNSAKLMAKILKNNGLIGILTLAYYRADVAHELGLITKDALVAYYKGIEAVIKSNKHDMDLSMLLLRDPVMEKDLRSIIADNWRNSKHHADLLKIFDSSVNFTVEDFIKKHRIQDELHYMDALWNYVLDRAVTEIALLKKSRKPLSYFSAMLEPQLIEDSEEFQKEVKMLKNLNRLFGFLVSTNDKRLANFSTAMMSFEFSSAAMVTFLEDYFSNARPDSKGMFALYLNGLPEVTTGMVFKRKIDESKIEQALTVLFGTTDPESVILSMSAKRVFVYTTGDAQISADMFSGQMFVDNWIAKCGDLSVSISPKNNKGGLENGVYTILKAEPYCNEKGEVSKKTVSLLISKDLQ